MTTSILSHLSQNLSGHDLQVLSDFALEAPYEWRKLLQALLEDIRGNTTELEEALEKQTLAEEELEKAQDRATTEEEKAGKAGEALDELKEAAQEFLNVVKKSTDAKVNQKVIAAIAAFQKEVDDDA